MKKSGKNVENARKKVEARPYKLAEATELIKKTHHTKFNETVELAINLGVDPKHSDQVVRGNEEIARADGEAVSDFAIDFEIGLLGIRNLAVVVDHAGASRDGLVRHAGKILRRHHARGARFQPHNQRLRR